MDFKWATATIKTKDLNTLLDRKDMMNCLYLNITFLKEKDISKILQLCAYLTCLRESEYLLTFEELYLYEFLGFRKK